MMSIRRQFTSPEAENDDASSHDEFSDDSSETAKQGNNMHVGPMDLDLWTDGTRFCSAAAALSILNLLALALDADFRCRTNHCPDKSKDVIWDMLGHIFTALALLEIVIRIVVARPKRYFMGLLIRGERFGIDVFNCVDFTLVFLRVLDCWILSPAKIKTNLRFLSGYRIYHVGPFVRQMKLTEAFRELWLVISAFGETLTTIVWLVLIILLITWFFGILLTILLENDSGASFKGKTWSFQDYWGSVPNSAYSLFQLSTADSWGLSLVWPLLGNHLPIFILFFIFFCIITIALMNSIVGVVVECIITNSAENQKRATKHRQKLDDAIFDSMQHIFDEADKEKTGITDLETFQDLLKRRRVRDRLKVLRIPLKDLELLFTLLDEEQNGKVKTPVFFRGSKKLRGQAVASDLNQLSIDIKRSMGWCDESDKKVNEINGMLATLLDKVDEADIDIVRGETDDKDPVLLARRQRKRILKTDSFQSQFKVGGSKIQSNQSLWEDFGKRSKNGSKNTPPGSSGAHLKKSFSPAGLRQARTQQDHGNFVQPTVQPPPPPLPTRVQSSSDSPSRSGASPTMARTAGPNGRQRGSFNFS